ncbi:MAG: M56 family metallopeptidase [bacterium]
MIELIKYQLIVTICIIVFYGFYKIFLKNETFFNFNRFLILFLISISFAIPLVKIGTSLPIVPQKPEIITIGKSSEIVSQPITETTPSIPIKTANQSTPINWNLLALYAIGILNLAGILWGLIRLTKSLLFFRYLRRKSEIATDNGTKFYIVPETIGSFSFFNSIFISKETINKGEVDSILAHELTHINEHHSIDSIFLAVVKSFLWFNPIIYLFEKELKTVHEYIADSSVIKQEQDKNNYIDILLNQTIGPKMFDLTNNFNSTTIFKRLKMITKTKSTKRRLWKYLVLFIPIALSLLVFSCKEEKNDDFYKNPREAWQIGWDKPAQVDMKWNDYERLLNSLQIMPKEAEKHNITSQVWIDYNINPDGSTSNFKFRKGKVCGKPWTTTKIGYGITDEAIRILKVLSKKVKWHPATLKGKPVKSTMSQSFIFGDREIWKMYSVIKHFAYMDNGSVIVLNNPCKSDVNKHPSWFTGENFKQISKDFHFPKKATKGEKFGFVTISFGITPKGDIYKPKIAQSAGNILDEAAMKAFKNLKGLKVDGFKHHGKRYKMEIWFMPESSFNTASGSIEMVK